MKAKIILLLAALALAGCLSNRGGSGSPPPYDTQSGAFLPETDVTDLHGMESGKFPPPTQR